MRKNRLIGWVLSVAMLAGMLPSQALAAPTTAQGDAISKYVTFEASNTTGAAAGYKLTVQVVQDGAKLAEQGYQYGQNGPGTVTVTPNERYTIDSMTVTAQDGNGDSTVFTSGDELAITQNKPRILTIAVSSSRDFYEQHSTIKNWSRSEEIVNGDTGEVLAKAPVDSVHGTDTKAMLNWNWDDVADIGTSVTDPAKVWDGMQQNHYCEHFLKQGRTSPYPSATWLCGKTPSLRRFRGEYTLPEGFSTRDQYRLKSANPNRVENILAINDDIFIFVYQEGEQLTNDNFMSYLAFWSGTSTRKQFIDKYGVVYSNERPGTIAYQKGNSIPLTDNWYCEAKIDNIGDVMYAHYPDAGEGTTFIVDMFCFDNSRQNGGGMDMLTIEPTDTTDLVVDIRYWKDAVGSGEDDPHFINSSSVKDLKNGDRITLTAEQLDKFRPAQYYGKGVQQETSPFIVKEGAENVINIVYTSEKARVQYDLNLPAGVSKPSDLTAPAFETVQKGSYYTIPDKKQKPSGLTDNAFESGNTRYTFVGWATSKESIDAVTGVEVTSDPTKLYAIWTTQTRSLTVSKELTDIAEPSSDSAWVSKGTQATEGDKLVYTITVTNGGQLDYSGLNLMDTLTVAGIAVNADKVKLISAQTPALDPANFLVKAGQSVIFNAEYIVTGDDLGKEIVNAVTVKTPDDKDQDPTDKTDPLTPVHKPGMTIEKTHEIVRNGDHTTLRVGDTVKYTVTIKNTGDQKLTGVKLEDTMFPKTVTDLQVNGKTAHLTGSAVAVGEIEVGGQAVVTYAYTVTEADEGKSVKNTATATSQAGPRAEDQTETDLVEGKTDVKLYYAFEQIEGGSTTTFPFETTPISVARKYPGDTVTKAEFEQAIAAHITLPEGVTETGSMFNRRGEAVANEIAASYVISDQAGMNDFAIKYPLLRHTITYRPGDHGALALAEGAKGELVSGSAVFTVPYGAVPAQWFTGRNGTLSLDKTAEEGYVFNGWDASIDLTAAVKRDLVSTAQWRARTSADRDYTVVIYQNEVEIDRRSDFALTYVPGSDAANATLTLDAAALLAEEQVRGKAAQGYKFGRYTATGEAGEILSQTHTFTITDGAVINVYYVPYDLTVWHQLSDAQPLFDEAQSVATLAAPATAHANADFFGLSRVRYQATAVAVNGAPDTAHTYTEAVAVPLGGGSYAVTFQYYRRSTSGGDNGGGNGNDGYQTIEDEEIPLAPGLNAEDHFAYVIGYPDGTVRPNANIDRQEVATIFFRLMQDDSRTENWSQTNAFSDVSATQWSNNAISTMAAAGILTGYEDGAFHPSAPITRGEFAAVAARFDSALYVGNDMFTDIAGHWAAPYINRAAQKGWIKGYEDGTFKPDQYITRAEAMTLVNAVLDRRVHAENVLDAAISWPDNPKDAWHYEAVQEATNSHNYDRENPTQYETWTELAQARDWTQLEKQWSAAAAPFGA